jgi:hypothetical protein
MPSYRPENARAGEAANEWLPRLLEALRAERKYKRKGPDMWLYYEDKHVGYIELEVKLDWETVEWPSVCKQCLKKGLKKCEHWDKVHFPERKARPLPKDFPIKPIFMVTFNRDGTNALVISHDMVFIPEHFGPRRWTRRGYEHFYEVPREKVVFGSDKIERYIIERLGLVKLKQRSKENAV